MSWLEEQKSVYCSIRDRESMRGDILGPNSPRKFSSQSVWRDWFDSNPLGRSQLWVEGSIPSSLTERGAHT